MKVLNDYALQKLGKSENQPLLPQIITIQRGIRRWMVRTRLKRCIRDGVKFIRGIKAMQRFADRAPFQNFLHKYDFIHGAQIEIDLAKKEKKLNREMRIAAGEKVSDSSS